MVTTQQGSNRFGLLYRSGLEPIICYNLLKRIVLMLEDDKIIKTGSIDFKSQQNDLAEKSSVPLNPDLDVWYVRKVGIMTLIISMVSLLAICVVYGFLISKVYSVAGGLWDPWDDFNQTSNSRSPEVWYYPVFILITLVSVYLVYKVVKLTRRMVIKMYPPVSANTKMITKND